MKMRTFAAGLWALLFLLRVDAATSPPNLQAVGLLAPSDATGIRVEQDPKVLRSQLVFVVPRSWDQSAISETSLDTVLGSGWRSCSQPPAVWEDFGEKQGERVVRIRQRLHYYSADTALLLIGERVEEPSANPTSTSPHDVVVRAVLQTFRDAGDLAQFLSSLQVACSPAK